MPDLSPQFIASLVTLLVVLHVILLSVAYLIMLERKMASWVQDRIGPNRTNFSFGLLPFKHHHFGLGQPLADGLKFLVKEEYTPANVDRRLFMLAPILAMAPAMLGWAVIPWGGYYTHAGEQLLIAAAPISIGVVYILAMGSLAVYGVVLAGFASNNKYSFLGGLRATAQMLSYEIPMGLCVLVVILMSRTMSAPGILEAQANGVWFLFYQPVLAIIFFTCVLAECNRAPFDLAECEQELVGGFHTEYSSMKFALFFLGEYMHMVTNAAFFVLLFLGGWDLPFVREPMGAEAAGLGWVLLKFGVFAGKVFLVIAFMILIRWTIPRFRFDQLMRLAWRSLIPITLVVMIATGFIVFWKWDDAAPWSMTVANVLVAAGVLAIGPLLPQGPPVNRRIPLAGSRFSPLVETSAAVQTTTDTAN